MADKFENGAPVKSATDARQGQPVGAVRWVLLASLVLAIVALGVIYAAFFG